MHFQFDIIVMQMDMMIAHLSLRIDLPAEIYQRTLSTLDPEIDVSGILRKSLCLNSLTNAPYYTPCVCEWYGKAIRASATITPHRARQ